MSQKVAVGAGFVSRSDVLPDRAVVILELHRIDPFRVLGRAGHVHGVAADGGEGGGNEGIGGGGRISAAALAV